MLKVITLGDVCVRTCAPETAIDSHSVSTLRVTSKVHSHLLVSTPNVFACANL